MILCCGEALIDMLPRESTGGEPAFAPYPGGALFNTAIALGRLGVPTGFFSGISSDLFGQQLIEAMAASNVSGEYAAISDRPTTLAFVRLTNGHASYAFYDENTAGRMLDLGDLPSLAPDVQALLFGAISLIPEPCGSAFETLMKREHQTRVTMLDPNIRPGFIRDKQKHLDRMRRMVAMSDIVKISDEDLSWFAEPGSHADVIARWLENGPKLIFMTNGNRGATAYTQHHCVTVDAVPVTVVDTVGAGDTFNAGVLASLQQNGVLDKPSLASVSETVLRDALALGVRAAAVTVSRAGANPPWRDDLR
ncbi:carbohydrate kinase [Mesorhizobium sp. NBSH29]|uniref:carbohydrate kinase family protein n=1 Tax=Mesorhizobium sp. NBSH29 TaxID=2654249 RepID=UPI001896720F|nr:carbohydrate kinase [Mesorhizobium sp. NBSH29]QPC87063.1 carbohydrate kinase [Mesorhizobium sp. NBSH29]